MPWTLTSANYSGTSFAAAGISSCQITKNGAGGDSCSLYLPGDSSGTPPFTELENVTIFAPDGSAAFRGFVDACPRAASATAQGWNVTLLGNLKKLDRITYLQRIQTVDDDGEPAVAFLAEGVLGYDQDGVRLNSAETIAEILAFASTAGSGLSTGSILSGTDITLPQMNVDSMTCLEAIRRVLMFHPDASLYLDHASNTVHVTRPASQSVVTRASSGSGSGANQVEQQGKRRYRVNGITIQWKTTSNVNGVEHTHIVTDAVGTSAPALDVVVIPIDLQGQEITTQSQECVTDTIPRFLTDFTLTEWKDFLLKNCPDFAATMPTAGQIKLVSMTQTIDESTKVGLGSIPEVDPDGGGGPMAAIAAYPRMLIGGSIPLWQAGISAAATRITVKLAPGDDISDNPALYALFDRHDEKTLELDIPVTGTDAQSITYTTATITEGESPVLGLALDYFTALNADAPAGIYHRTTLDPDYALAPGKRLTLTGPWPCIAAVIQQVTLDVFSGKAAVRFGPNGILSPPDMVSLLRAGSRSTRLRNTGSSSRTSSTPSGREIKGTTGGATRSNPATRTTEAYTEYKVKQLTCSGTSGSVSIGGGTLITGTPGTVADEYNNLPIFPAAPIRTVDVSGASSVTVNDGDTIWAKVTYEGVSSYALYGGENTTIGIDPYRITCRLQIAWALPYAVDHTAYVAQPTQPPPLIEGYPAEPGDTVTNYAYWPIARIAIADGIMTIHPIQTTPLAPPVWCLPCKLQPSLFYAD